MFNVSIVTGLVGVGVGVLLMAGPGPALVVVGSLIILLALYAAERLTRRG